MKKLKLAAAALLALTTAIGMTGCSSCEEDQPIVPNPPPIVEPEDFVSVSVTQTSVSVKDYEVEGYNFARFFRINDNGTTVQPKGYVDVSAVKAEVGEYAVKCTYKEKTATLTVKVVQSDSVLTLSKTELKLNTSEVADYDFKSLFALTVDGKSFAITDAMVSSDIRAEAGVYTYSVTFFGNTKTLKVTVIDENAIEIINSYSLLEITKEELADFDFTNLFSLYVGGVAEKVLLSYIDASAIENPEEGRTYPIVLSFEKNGTTASSTAEIKVVGKTQLSIASKNIVTYPNGEDIDLKSLFTIKNGNQTITVTDDMVSGTVDYSKEGDNIITLNYGGKVATATVTIKLGVIIDYASSDIVIIEKGTSVSAYDFASDFVVIINGIRFTDLQPSYFDTTGVDFGKEGEYEVKLTVPYNTKPLGLSGVNFDYFEKTIIYRVVEKKTEYSIKILQDTVSLPAGTTRYNVYDNLNVVVNGVKRKLYEDKDNIDITTCYAQTVSAPIDFTSPADQTVEIDVYVFGPDEEPVRVAYAVRIANGVTVTGKQRMIFSGTTVYARELFTITENGENVPVTDDMVSGKIDLFNAGLYYVTASYKGVTAQSVAIVLDSAMTGTYKSKIYEIEQVVDEDDDDYGEWGDGWGEIDPDGYSTYAQSDTAKLLADIVIDENGDIYWGNYKAEIFSIIDDGTFIIKLGMNEFVFNYSDGIITLDPDTSTHSIYHDFSRPLVYFNENRWTVEGKVQINSNKDGYSVYHKDHVGNLITSGGAYTLDIFKLKSVEDGGYYWYAMKTTFTEKIVSNTYYADEIFGFATFAPGFEQKQGCVSSVSLGGESYEFTMSDPSSGIINKQSSTVSAFAGMNFKGTVDGASATFAVSVSDRITYTLDGKRIFDYNTNEQNSMKNGGPDYASNTWLVYSKAESSDKALFSYRFRLDTENKTFTIDEKDDLYGKYVCGNVYFFFDGYGTGEVNFDMASQYATTAFSYKRNGANIEITYLNPRSDFAYGKKTKFLLGDYKNVLTVREIEGIDLVGKQFVNSVITDGAIVSVNNFVLGKGTAEKELYDGISIVTKDGALTAAQMKGNIAGTKTKYVDASLIRFSNPGCYQLKINIPMDGGIKTAYYAVQILDNIYSGNPIVGRYSQSTVSKDGSLNIDEYGRLTGIYSGISFTGSAKLSDGSFTATAVCSSGKFTLTGELLKDGIVAVTARGALMFTECFTSGTSKVCGTEGFVFRVVTAGDSTVYMLSHAVTSLGDIVEVEGNVGTFGSVLKLIGEDNEYFVKVTQWGNADRGLTLADAVMGTYTLAGADDLVLDGFGTATVGARKGSYAIYGTGITVNFGSELVVYRIDANSKTYKVSDIPVDEALFAGKSFTSTYLFKCENCEYNNFATTVFEFMADGKVTVKSSSSGHDEECTDKYSPEFATSSGTEGTFTVAGNKITVLVNGITITFKFNDAVGLNTITCSSTYVDSSSHGYFAPDTEFTRV